LHFPYSSAIGKAGRLERWALPTTASCGARTFLSPQSKKLAVAFYSGCGQRPSCRLAKHYHYNRGSAIRARKDPSERESASNERKLKPARSIE